MESISKGKLLHYVGGITAVIPIGITHFVRFPDGEDQQYTENPNCTVVQYGFYLPISS
ncbi:MAG: hypothetical protein KAR16_03940 [Bacteroidales bacterium]|nr:hypothetical protein [Bacteroidales bacterium]